MIQTRYFRIGASSAFFLTIAAQIAGAQINVDSLRKSYLLRLPKTIEVAASASRGSPGTSDGSPSAYGANWGDGFMGAGLQGRVRYSHIKTEKGFRNRSDGGVVAGLGLGNSRDYIGLEAAITSFSTFRSGFGNHNGISLKLHRVFPKNFGVAVGWENAFRTDGLDGGNSAYGVISTVIKTRERAGDPFSSVSFSVGGGGGRFQTEKAIRAGKNSVNAFGSFSVRLLSPFSLIADWNGQDLTAALSMVPFVRIPLVITPGVADLTRTAGDGPRFTLGVGMGFRFGTILDILAPNRTD